MYIPRLITPHLEDALLRLKKTVVLYGPRQAGKTTLVRKMLEKRREKTLSISADEKKYADIFSSRDASRFESVVAGYDILFIDEAQRIENIGLNLKILHDQFPSLRTIVTGSSSFERANRLSEPLTGRSVHLRLLPLGISELRRILTPLEVNTQLDELLVYGLYPEVYTWKNRTDKEQCLRNLSSNYLFKDIFELSGIKKHRTIEDLLKLLAYQIGSEVSSTELAAALGISKDTVLHYIDLLEKSFVVFRLSGFSGNLRKEIAKMDKIFFFDNGIRNAAVSDFRPIDYRNDIGALWENFMIAERYKRNLYKNYHANRYFWRTYTGAELDYVEEHNNALTGYEIKWKNKRIKAPRTWTETYDAGFQLINRDTWLSFVE